VEEIYPDGLPALEVAPYLAKLKAKGSLHLLEKKEEVLLTADSVVIIDGVIYGKPKDRAAAIATIKKMSGRMHTVVTGCCLMNRHRNVVFSGISDVYFNELSREEIEWYVDECQPFDKAGAYGIQEWIGLAKIRKIVGTYPNIMGLPVDLVYEHLMAWMKE